MAASTLTVTVTNTESTQNMLHVYGSIAVQASPGTYTTGGNTLSFANFDVIKSSQVPIVVEVYSAAPAGSTAANLYIYSFSPGTTLANGVMQIFTGAAAQTALTELSAGNMPSGVSGDTINFHAVFPRL